MKLKQLVLKNFCQHSDRTIELSNGLMGILGANGSGKSNLINGIIYAITGTLPNNLAQYVKQGSTGNSFAQLTFVSDLTGMTYVVKRGLHPRRSELTCVDTGQTIRKSKDIDAFLIDTLKIDFNIIKNVLTVSQEDFVSFFRATPSARAEILTRLFGFLELKTARESLRQLLTSTQDESENVSKLKAYKELLAEKERSLEPYKDVESPSVIQERIKEATDELAQITELINLYKTKEYFDQQKGVLANNLRDVRLKMKLLGEVPDLESMERTLNKLREIEAVWTYDVETGNRLYTIGEEVIKLQAEYLKAYRDLQDAKEPYESDEDYETMVKNRNAIEAQLNELREFAEKGCCPTCGQPFPDISRKLEETYEKFNMIDTAYFESTVIRKHYQNVREALDKVKEAYKRRYDDLKSIVDSWKPSDHNFKNFKELMAAFPGIRETLSGWHSNLFLFVQDIVSGIKENQRSITKAENEYEEAKKKKEAYDQLSLSESVYTTQFNEIDAHYPKFADDALPLDRAKAKVEGYNILLNDYNKSQEISLRAESIREQINDLNLKIGNLEKIINQDKEKVKCREVVSEVCEILANDAFPKYVMIGLLEMLTGNINYYLTTFNAPFTVRIDNASTELYCEFTNGETFLASELSGGQKMVLAISWRLALHNTFATEESCGFLTLDEPTNHLDENNIQNLTQVMAQVKEAARDKNLQVLVITHEKALEPLFDAVIRL